MSDLEDLEDVADTWAYRNHSVFSGPRTVAKKPATELCRNGHVRTEKNTRWSKRPRDRKPQRYCIECKRINDGYKGVYKLKCEAT